MEAAIRSKSNKRLYGNYGETQPGLLQPVDISAGYHLLVIDLKDCFFSIPKCSDKFDAQSRTAADWYWWPVSSGMRHFKWKNLTDGTWCGPDTILVWRRGAVCVFPQDADSPVWVPEHLVHGFSCPAAQEQDRAKRSNEH